MLPCDAKVSAPSSGREKYCETQGAPSKPKQLNGDVDPEFFSASIQMCLTSPCVLIIEDM